MSLDMFQNYSVNPKAGKEVMIISTDFGKELVIVLSEVKTCVKYADHEYDKGLDPNVNCHTEESSQMKSLE